MRLGKLWFALVLAGALGCQEHNGGGDAGFVPDDAGRMPMMMPPPAMLPDSGTSVVDSGADGAIEPMLPPNFELECGDAPEAPDDPLAVWAEERDAHGAIGRPATFALHGATYRIEGKGVADVEAPFTLVAGKISGGLIDFEAAHVDDIEERGKLTVFTGDNSSSTPREAEAVAGGIEQLGIKTVLVEGGSIEGMVDVVSEQVGNSDFHRASASVVELELEGVSRASLLPEGGFGNDARIEWMPTGSVVIHEAAQLTFHEEGFGSVRKASGAALDVDYEQFGVGGDFASGSIEIEGERVQGTPVAVFGRAATLRAEAGSVEALDGLRITQAINEVGLVVPASVEIVPESPEVWVSPGEERVVRFFFRERSYTGDAVLGEIQTGGSASDLLELQTGFLENTLTEQLIGAVIETGWAAPIAAIASIPAISVVFVIDLFECIFGGCLDQPAPLEPFPQWIDAGGIGTMEVRVKGALGVGTYETSLTFVGRNYCPVTVPLTVHVGQEPPAPSDGGADAGDAGAADGG